jgi:ABC-type transport system substrate-binding protein
VIPAVYSRDVQIRAQFPALTANVTQLSERAVFNKLESFNIPTADNRWAGFNRGAWANPEFDRLEVVFNTTMERPSRDQAVIQMMKIVADDVGVIPLYYNLDAVAFVGALSGPTISSPDTTRDWNVQDWHWIQ